MARSTPLRSVAPGEKAKPKAKAKVLTVAQAAADGTAREELVALRARIAKAIDDPNIRGADLASLSRRLMEIRKDIEALDARDEQEAGQSGPTVDEKWSAI